MPGSGPDPAPSIAPGTVAGVDRTDLAADNPEAYLPRDRRRALAAAATMPDRVRGAALFADISGFTPLTEALASELGPQRGAEELTANIGRVFHAVIEELDRQGGDVIYFSGDAITCWIGGDDGVRAAAAALAMQDAIARTGTIVTPGGSTVTLAMKVAVAVGAARRFLVGDPEIQLVDVLAGRLIDDLAAAEHHAEKGEIVLEPSARLALGDRVTIRAERTDEASGRTYAVLDRLLARADPLEVLEPPPLPEDLVRPWLLPAVYERLRTGRGEFLAELRPAIPLFLRFGGIDYDHDDDAIGKLDEFVRAAQRVMDGYGGNVLQLTLGDKGAYLYGVFGSPLAHEDDAARAAAAALDLRDLERTTAAEGIQVGLTHGRLRSGTYGHAMRRTFVCLGDAVNLSARLMSAAPAGHVYVADAVRQAAGDAFLWDRLPDLRVKGKAEPIAVWSLRGSLERASRRRTRFELRLVGRTRELAALDAALEAALAGRGRVLGIAAEAGMGKSRLVAEFVRDARRRGLFVAFGECQAFGSSTAYFPWREVWRRLLHLEDGEPATAQVARVAAELDAVEPGLAARAPLLDVVLGLEMADTELTASFDPKLRKASLEDLLARCLRARAATEPLVVVIEDGHWIDELSRDLLGALVRAADASRVLFVLAYRPAPEAGGGLGVARLAAFDEVVLDRLSAEESAIVVRSKLGQVLGTETEAPDALVELVTARADGNPFYVEELVSFIAGRGVNLADAGSLAELELPESLHSLVLSRIDTVAEEPRRTLKVASVVGRVFEAPVLPGAYPDLGALDEVERCLDVLRAADLVTPERAADRAWLFKHVVTQEVAYESMPFAVRTMLHGRVGRYLEALDPGGGAARLDLLAHHFWLGDDETRKRAYLARAADAARDAYANTAAITYYERLVPLLEGPDRVAAMRNLAKVLELSGAWPGAEEVLVDARARASAAGDVAAVAWCDASLAEVTRKQGRFDDAVARLDAASAGFEAAGADDGLGQVLHLAGTVAAQRGDLPGARTRYEQSLAIRERLGDRAGMAALYSNLGVVAEYGGDYAAARAYNERALHLRTEIGDRWAIAVSHNNLGMIALHERRFEEARDRFRESMRLNREVGDAWMVAIGHNNLGNAHRGLGDLDAARRDYAASLTAYRAWDDRWAMAFLLEDIGVLAARRGDRVAPFELLGAAETMRADIGSPRADALQEELDGHLAEALVALGDEAADAAVRRGKALTLDEAIARALAVCSI